MMREWRLRAISGQKGRFAQWLAFLPYSVGSWLEWAWCASLGHPPARGGKSWTPDGTSHWWQCRCGQKGDSDL
jgi:hypothetical protein